MSGDAKLGASQPPPGWRSNKSLPLLLSVFQRTEPALLISSKAAEVMKRDQEFESIVTEQLKGEKGKSDCRLGGNCGNGQFIGVQFLRGSLTAGAGKNSERRIL
jgi:hypothetical protein